MQANETWAMEMRELTIIDALSRGNHRPVNASRSHIDFPH